MYFGRVIPMHCIYWAPNEEAELHESPMTPKVNGPTNIENTMLTMWGSHRGVQMMLSSHPADETEIPNPLWCIYWTPVEEFEDEETPEEQEN